LLAIAEFQQKNCRLTHRDRQQAGSYRGVVALERAIPPFPVFFTFGLDNSWAFGA
jgi:hypothetical protein